MSMRIQIYQVNSLPIFIILFILLIIHPVSAVVFFHNGTDISGAHLVDFLNNNTNISSSPFPIQFFYNTHCGSCISSIKYIENFTLSHPDTGVVYHDLYNNTESFALFEEAKKQFNRSDLYYPVIFIGDMGIMGSPDIINYTELLAFWYQQHNKTDPVSEFNTWLKSII